MRANDNPVKKRWLDMLLTAESPHKRRKVRINGVIDIRPRYQTLREPPSLPGNFRRYPIRRGQTGVKVSAAVKVLVVTHWHDDHMRGAAATLKEAESALCVCSAALRGEEFRELVAANDLARTSRFGTSELSAIYGILTERQPRAARRSSVGPEMMDTSVITRASFHRPLLPRVHEPAGHRNTQGANINVISAGTARGRTNDSPPALVALEQPRKGCDKKTHPTPLQLH